MREVTPLRGHTPTSPRPYEATPYEATPLRGHAHYDAAALRGHFPMTPHPFEATPLRGRAPECDQSAGPVLTQGSGVAGSVGGVPYRGQGSHHASLSSPLLAAIALRQRRAHSTPPLTGRTAGKHNLRTRSAESPFRLRFSQPVPLGDASRKQHWISTAHRFTTLVDGAIHRAAGPQLKEECATLLGCETGQAKVTGGYGLPAKYVIHTVGPIVQRAVGDQERRALRASYRSSLEAAAPPHVAARSLAFPCISTGIYGYPPDQAVHVALATVREYLDEHPDKLDRVIFCVFLPADRELYLKNLPLYFPGEAAVRSKL
ncbi:unnamed protein product [Gadus morhua 'NCC']